MSLINWTEQGIKNFRDTAQRADEFSKLVQGSGGRVRELLGTVGEYDIVCVADFPDDEAGVAALVRVGSAGNIAARRCAPSTLTRWQASSGALAELSSVSAAGRSGGSVPRSSTRGWVGGAWGRLRQRPALAASRGRTRVRMG